MFAEESMPSGRSTNRRDFVRHCLAGSLAPASSSFITREAQSPNQKVVAAEKSRVAIARDAQLRGARNNTDSNGVLKLLDRSMQTFFGSDNVLDPWRKMVRPNEVVGLKVNCLAGKGLSTNVLLVEAVVERLQQAGIPAGNIVIWDRSNADLESAGFKINTRPDRLRCMGNDVLGYEEDLAAFGSAGSRICKTVTQLCNAVISLPILKDHGIVGMTMALKNFFGAIHNPNKYHLQAGDPYVADVWMLPPIRQKTRLTICDATTACYEGGPSFLPQWTWPYNGLIVSRDPVALDHTGWQIIENKRAEKGMKSLAAAGREPRYIATAADPQHRLGTNDPTRIEVVQC
jgi:uncharacterized protein (DUF362 family)